MFQIKKYYDKKGRLHREDGPAIIFKNGLKYWYLYGKEVTEEQVRQFKVPIKIKFE